MKQIQNETGLYLWILFPREHFENMFIKHCYELLIVHMKYRCL